MSDHEVTSPGQTTPTAGRSAAGSAAHPIMFWVLTVLALLIFAPSVLVPLWLEKEQLREYERCLAGTVAQFEFQVARGQARTQALLTDPQVNERIIRRELNVQPRGEQVIRWSAEELGAAWPEIAVPASQPAASGQEENSSRCVAVLAQWLPDWPYRDLFARSPQRPLLMAMAGGLLLAAFMLYAPSPSSPKGEDQTADG